MLVVVACPGVSHSCRRRRRRRRWCRRVGKCVLHNQQPTMVEYTAKHSATRRWLVLTWQLVAI